MNAKKLFLAVFAAISVFSATQSNADVLYTNGTDSLSIGYTINNGYSVSNSFTLTSAATLTSITFSNWLSPDDSAKTVDWSITTSAFGGATIGSGFASPLASVSAGIGAGYYTVNDASFSLANLSVSAGTYWLQLENLATSNQGYGYWGTSGGSSLAHQFGNDYDYDLPTSQSFTVFGTMGAVPEPASLALLGLGLAGLGFSRRRQA